MPWSVKQQKLAMIAARGAGWNEEQRYIAMRHVGMPQGRTPAGDRPSVHHPRNDHRHFERYMALAESCALSRGEGDAFPRAAGGRLWRDAAAERTDRVVRLIKRIEAEAVERLPMKFAPGFVHGLILRVCGRDEIRQPHIDVVGVLADLDDGQAYRVLEAMKAWVGRELGARGMEPRTFVWTPLAPRAEGEELAA